MSNPKIHTVLFPDIGEGVVEGEVVQWLKQTGDLLQQDEAVVTIMTDKATVELPSPYPGRLAKQHRQPGETIKKDHPLYDIEILEGAVVSAAVESSSKTAVLAAPHTRQLAEQLGVDLHQIYPSGKEGEVTEADLISFHQEKKVHSTAPLHLPGDSETPLIGIRNLMAKKMGESKKTIPHFSYFEQLDATRLVQLRHHIQKEAEREGIHVTYIPFILKALSLTLRRYPLVNSSLDQETNKIITHQQQHIGIATSTKEGLIVPVLKNVQELSLKEIIHQYEQLKQKALSGNLSPAELKGSTFTISNFGVLGGGGMWATPIINYPEAAILAIARIKKHPVVRNDMIVIRDLLNLSWSFDHRIIDGDLAATFSHHFSTLLENPASLL